MDLNNRELATVIWLAVILILVVIYRPVRVQLPGLFKAALTPVIVIPLLLMVAYTLLLVRLGSGIGLWTKALITETVVWFVISGLVLFYKVTEADQPGFFRRTIIRTLGATLVIEFFMNLFVMSLWLELALQPWIFVWTGVEIVSKDDPAKQPAKKVASFFISATGIAVGIYVIWQLITNWRSLFTLEKLLEFDLPIWMTVGLIPFIYLLSVYVAYDHAIRHVIVGVDDVKTRWRVVIALLTSVFGRRKLRALRFFHASRAAQAGTFRETRRVIRQDAASHG